jgi:hypothetical protein
LVRLTLNVLLSFAQFEREVTSERIRDKIAASKKKGMWMGGLVPLGYRAKDRSLEIDESEAETVRTLFSLYLDLGNVRLVKEAADRLGLTTKRRLTVTGRSYGGCRFSRGAIYQILSNPVYVGEIVHKAERHPGAHLPIVDRETWDNVQNRLADNASRQKAQATAASPSLLTGLIFDEAGQPLTPTHANKQGRRYRYYVSQSLVNGDQHSDQKTRPGSWRLPASAIEELAVNGLCDLLLQPARLAEEQACHALTADQLQAFLAGARQLGEAIQQGSGTERTMMIRTLVQRITIASDSVKLDLDRPALLSAIADQKSWADDKGARQGTLSLSIPIMRQAARIGAEAGPLRSTSAGQSRSCPDLKSRPRPCLAGGTEDGGGPLPWRHCRAGGDLGKAGSATPRPGPPAHRHDRKHARRTAADRADHGDGEEVLSAPHQLGGAASGPRLQLNPRAAILYRFHQAWPAAHGARLTHLLASSAAGSSGSQCRKPKGNRTAKMADGAQGRFDGPRRPNGDDREPASQGCRLLMP